MKIEKKKILKEMDESRKIDRNARIQTVKDIDRKSRLNRKIQMKKIDIKRRYRQNERDRQRVQKDTVCEGVSCLQDFSIYF